MIYSGHARVMNRLTTMAGARQHRFDAMQEKAVVILPVMPKRDRGMRKLETKHTYRVW